MRTTCRACGRAFGGLTGFEKHRTGAYTDTPPDYGRRCRSDEEMTASGYHEANGVWVKPASEKQLARFRSLHD